MDWTSYKALCNQPDYWSRWMLEQCLELFIQLEEHELSALLVDALAQSPLRTPADHKGSAATQMFQLSLSQRQRLAAMRAIELAAARGLSSPLTSARGLGGFIEAWREYSEYPA